MKQLDALRMNRGFLNMRVEEGDSEIGKGLQKDVSSTFETHDGWLNGNTGVSGSIKWLKLRLSQCLAHRKGSKNRGDQTFWFAQYRLRQMVSGVVINSCSYHSEVFGFGWLISCSPYQQMTAFQLITS